MVERCFHHIGWKLLPFLYFFSSCCGLPDGDLCRWMNGRKYYIDVGESGIISAENVTSQTKTGSSDHPQIPQRCSVELVTCSSCHFQIYAIHINVPTCSSDNTCRCDFVWVKETAYSKSGQEFCGHVENSSSSLTFESKTKQVSVDFLYTGSYTSAFALHFSAIKNVYVYKGGYDHYQGNSTGSFSSPNFPGGYPSDYSAEYILQNADTSGFVQLLFSDFQLSLWSYMEVLDSNGSRIDVYNGNTFRPPAIISSGPTLTIKFQANEEYSSSGFLATYSFVGYGEKYWVNRPSTDCGGVVEDFGGAITMMNMVPGNMMQAFDCIWLIRPHSASVTGKQVSVRVAQFEDMGPKSTLSIRQGLYSTSALLESVTPFQQHELHRGQEYVVSASIGFYIRLIGYFKDKSHLAIIYSTFQYEGCFALVDFECGNGRCVKNTLRCDGFNHCGDGTDESSCYGSNQGTQSPEDVNWWRTLTPNYYFPKSDTSNNAGTNTLILVTSLAGLGMFVLTTVVILVKLHKQRQDDTISREILQTISADIEAENALHHHRGSDPPLYDPPPSYDDVIKFYLPPPPAYSRVGSDPNTQARNSGENASRSPPTTARGRSQRTKHPKQMPPINESHPSVLQVTLPEEEGGRPVQPVQIKSPATDSPVRSTTASSHIEVTKLPEIRTVSIPSNDGSLESAAQQPTSFQNPNIACYKSSYQNVKYSNASCECQGACSCSTEYHSEAHKTRLPEKKEPPNLLCLKRANSAKQSDKDSIVPFPHPPAMVITVKQAKSDCANQRVSHSAGPSSPNEHSTDDGRLKRMSHRRSSSDPSQPENQGRTRGSHHRGTELSQEAKNLASSLLNGLHESFTSRRSAEPEQANKSEKNILPSGWGHLWNPVRRRPDNYEAVQPVAGHLPWLQSDTQPLLWKLPPRARLVDAANQRRQNKEESPEQ